MAFTKVVEIEIPAGKVASDLTDFPLFLRLNDPTLRTVENGGLVENDSGFDVCFFADPALTTPLYWDSLVFDGSDNYFHTWVLIPTLYTAAPTKIYMAYGDSSISTYQSTRTSVWPSASYRIVYPLNQASGGSLSTVNKTGLGNGSPTGSMNYQTAGKLQYALEFTGGYILGPAQSSPFMGVLSISCWLYDSLGAGATRYSFLTGQQFNDFRLVLDSSNRPRVTFRGFSDSSDIFGSAISTGVWTHVYGTFDGTNMRLYVNGSLVATSGSTTSPTVGSGVRTAIWWTVSGLWSGRMEHQVYQRVARNADWIAAEYSNQNDPDNFYTAHFGPLPPIGRRSMIFFG